VYQSSFEGKVYPGLDQLGRQFSRLSKDKFLILYKTYVRPHMAFCIQAWSPYLQKLSVQRRATKMVRGLRDVPYDMDDWRPSDCIRSSKEGSEVI